MFIEIKEDRSVYCNGKYISEFTNIQEEIYKKNPSIVRKYAIKAKYLGNGNVRFIADWEKIIIEYLNNSLNDSSRTKKEGGSTEENQGY